MHHVSALRLEDQPAEEADVFKALADPSRRLLLDSLFEEDAQTLGELSARLSGMTRFGVMKHLRILEAAGLITSRKVGRERLHYLNPVPIRLIHDRWIGKYAEPRVSELSELTTDLQSVAMEQPRHVFQVYIRTTPEQLRQAIGDPKFTSRYLAAAGEVVDADPPSRVTWEIEPRGNTCKLTVVHDGLPGQTATFRSVGSVWPLLLSSLKTLLETGEGLDDFEN